MPPQRMNRDQGRERRKTNQKEEEEQGKIGAENLQNLKWERHFYYHEEEEREVIPLLNALDSPH